ncbi:MAG: Asp-tRNA(Asn)/Glu-tRNA(Gln) amidotransferase subunit GatC [Synergistaceae bacterium]|nr:Asp-tRNA(Asn)/Glu-tRNA(Gln) amidotransferase subunit GatC [Synergistaceae bacterium]
MLIDEKLIDYLEELSCLTLSFDEKQRISGDLKEILGYMERLGELDTGGVPERSHPFDNVNAFRDDIAGESFDRELILKNAPRRDDRMFISMEVMPK